MGLTCPRYVCVPRPKDCVWVAAWTDCSGWFGISDVCGSYHDQYIKNFTISNRKALPGCFVQKWSGVCMTPTPGGFGYQKPATAQTDTVRFWGGCRGKGPQGWATPVDLADFLGVPANMRQNIQKSYNVYGGNAASSWFMDENCNYVQAPADTEICGYGGISWSPIALLWREDVNLSAEMRVVPFAIDASRPGSFSLWKASADAPLLVFDPERSGEVRSAKQLFGSYAFGGKTAAPRDYANDQLREPWANGYEALGLLDADADGKVSDAELEPLALWFDANRSGTVDAGELRAAASEGVTALYYRDAKQLPSSRDMALEVGYDRVVNGELRHGRSVDWFAETFETRQEAAEALQAEFAKQTPAKPSAQLDSWLHDPMKFAPRPVTDQRRDVSGYWLWSTDEKGGESHPGLFAFQQLEQGRVIGFSVVETVLEENEKKLRSAVLALPASGSVTRGEDGKLELVFDISGETGSAKSSAVLSADGTTLEGQTTQSFTIQAGKEHGSATVQYRWVARKFVE